MLSLPRQIHTANRRVRDRRKAPLDVGGGSREPDREEFVGVGRVGARVILAAVGLRSAGFSRTTLRPQRDV
jgi:hypothetical protein